MASTPTDEKLSVGKQTVDAIDNESSIRNGIVAADDKSEEHEVFAEGAEGVDFRTVTWQRMIIILLKVQVATGVLSIPSAMGSIGAVPGALSIVGWQALNTCEL
jgi:hypothetical protein